ncbi:MAG TPA: TetR/AcrR family transcriptional regulator [Herpetosiphon sp.]|uniref:Transcriptional regulator, TetR family n=1 Tax=Herpetosiphon aurantiacus (strain ATCC 23779 / DSM 785 / 114-95) TaxID=316274 RepID=A9AXB0_HERA2|nr:TetR/AcrR family transcriptional regulator [Herpetosiphon sp.]ABX06830.1 transcriptional regulator, TetR family [Herpetosiphon aurantiacus DSM 785]HBW52820.1 TetR/AcrR family transcriptional regulator [Herpetosiphon sp.]
MAYPAQTDYPTIIRTAQRLIERDGVEQLALASLANELGIKAPSLYRYVANKNALLKGVVTVTIQQLFAAYDQVLATSPNDAQSQLVAISHGHRQFAHAQPKNYALALTAASPEQRADPALLVEMVLPIQAIMAQISGQEHSLAALRGLLGLIHGFVLLELNQQLQRGGDLSSAFDLAVRSYLAGLTTLAAA